VVDEPAVEVPVDSAPDTTAPAAPTADTTETSFAAPAVALEIPASAVPNDSSLTNPQAVTESSPNIAPEATREVPGASATTTNDATLEISAKQTAGNETAGATSGSLPMTGAMSLLVVGLAASLLAAGWLVIAGRRRKVVA
jgi:LPXTG-motif cell wall-anchored protein